MTTSASNNWYVAPQDQRRIDLVSYLPGHFVDTGTHDLLKFFEDTLNTLYVNKTTGATKGILQKIEDLATLHDANTIDIEFIGQLMQFLGYPLDQDFGSILYFQKNKALSRSDIGGSVQEVTDADYTDEELNKTIRHMVTELPSWYRIKGTGNLVKVLLYTFGLVGELVEKWTSEYDPGYNGYANFTSQWYDRVGDEPLSSIPKNYFPTPHFTIRIDVTDAPAYWVKNISQLIKSVESIKPLNTVFEYIAAQFKSEPAVYVSCDAIDIVRVYVPWDDAPFS